MTYKIIPTDVFLKDVKSLKKKYRNIIDDIDDLAENLEQNPTTGKALGRN